MLGRTGSTNLGPKEQTTSRDGCDNLVDSVGHKTPGPQAGHGDVGSNPSYIRVVLRLCLQEADSDSETAYSRPSKRLKTVRARNTKTLGEEGKRVVLLACSIFKLKLATSDGFADLSDQIETYARDALRDAQTQLMHHNPGMGYMEVGLVRVWSSSGTQTRKLIK